ncbi:MAG: LysR family transcriptional regulator [Syntrophorhabdales bacterium]
MVFSTLVRFKSFTQTAGVLHMTQPGVSNHVAQLEAQTGLTLIKRERGKFEITKEGRAVYRYAERIEAIARELDDRFLALRSDVTRWLCIGTTINYAKSVMPLILGGFQKRVPNIKIKLESGPSEEMEKDLISGKNDVIIVASRHTSKKVHSFPFLREELVLITSNDHPLARKRAVSLTDIRSCPFIIREEGSATRGVVLDAFAAMDIVPSVFIEANSTDFIKEWVSQGKGVSIIIERAIGPAENHSLTRIPLLEPLFMKVSVAYLKSRRYDLSVQAFVAYLREFTVNPLPKAVVLEKGVEGTRKN